MTDPEVPTLRDRIRDAIANPAAAAGDSQPDETHAEWAARAVLAVIDAETPPDPAGHRPNVRHVDATRAAMRAYRAAGGTEPTSETSLIAAVEAAFAIAEQVGRNRAAAAIRATDHPYRSRYIAREIAARIAAGVAASSGPGSAIVALLDRIPGDGQTWTKESRDLMVATFGNLLDLFHPVVDRSRIGVPVALAGRHDPLDDNRAGEE